jgi:hypothetical protein
MKGGGVMQKKPIGSMNPYDPLVVNINFIILMDSLREAHSALTKVSER